MESYNPREYGAVVAIRIFYDYDNFGYTPMAELAFAFGGTEIIPWDEPAERERFSAGINGYTYIYDERPKRQFADWVTRRNHDQN